MPWAALQLLHDHVRDVVAVKQARLALASIFKSDCAIFQTSLCSCNLFLQISDSFLPVVQLRLQSLCESCPSLRDIGRVSAFQSRSNLFISLQPSPDAV